MTQAKPPESRTLPDHAGGFRVQLRAFKDGAEVKIDAIVPTLADAMARVEEDFPNAVLLHRDDAQQRWPADAGRWGNPKASSGLIAMIDIQDGENAGFVFYR